MITFEGQFRGGLVHYETNQRAKALRPIFRELADLSANAAAAELNRRGIATPQGGQWHSQVRLECPLRAKRHNAVQQIY